MTRFLLIGLALTIILTGCQKKKEIEAKSVTYTQGGQEFEGYFAWNKNSTEKRPGILVIHEWTGLGEYVQSRARQLAELGYVAFAMDMYGKGIRAKDHEEAAKLSGRYGNDRGLMRSRMVRALEVLKENEFVDPDRIAVIGYCFGGMSAIELALSGADVDGVVAFHAMLASPNMKDADQIKGKILVHHGADDPFVPEEAVDGFREAMDEEGVDYEFVSHPGAVHAFTRPTAKGEKNSAIKYNKEADKKSWASMKKFLNEIF